MAAQNLALPAVYAVCTLRPVKKGLVIFADAHHDSRPDNMKELYEALNRMKKGGAKLDIREHYLNFTGASFSAILRHMMQFMKLYAQAEAVIICDNYLPAASCRKRRETMVVQLWHACGALKKFGYDTTDDIPENYRGNVFRNIDLVTVSAPFCEAPFASAMRLDQSCVRSTGVCRTDRYFRSNFQENARRRFLEKYPQARGKKVAVWAPTFRGNPAEPQLLPLNVDQLRKDLGEDWFVLEHLHPHMAAKYTKGTGSVVYPDPAGGHFASPGSKTVRPDSAAHPDAAEKSCASSDSRTLHRQALDIALLPVEVLYAAADVMIADYSSLIYEYLLFGKPLVLYIPDYAEYVGKRGFYMDYSEIPGQRVYREEDLAQAILGAQAELAGQKEKTAHFLETYMCACDGHSTERVLALIEEHIYGHKDKTGKDR